MPLLRLFPRAGGAPIEFTAEQTILGRDPSCHVVIEDRSISRRHASVEQRGDLWHVVDRGSANGTFVNGERVTESPLANGNEVTFGTVRYRVEVLEESTVLLPAVRDVPRTAPPPPAPAPHPARVEPAPGTPEAAAALLGVPLGAPPEHVQSRFEELTNDIQTRLAGARAPTLKRTYEKSLQELREAFEQLCPAQGAAVDVSDLPSAQPVVLSKSIESMVMKAPSRAVIGDEEPAVADAGLSTTVSLFGGVSILLIGVLAFFFMSGSKIRSRIAEEEAAPELRTARQDAESFRTTETLVDSGALQNGKLVLCNESALPLDVLWLSAIYIAPSEASRRDDIPQYKLRTFNSSFCGRDYRMVLATGAQKTFDVRSEKSERCNWDGSAVFYALAIRRPGAEEAAWFSGLQNRTDECVKVGSGW